MKAIITICDDISAMSFVDVEGDTEKLTERLPDDDGEYDLLEESEEKDWKQLDDAQRYRDLKS